MYWIRKKSTRGFIHKMEVKNDSGKKKSFRWIFSVIGEVLLVIPIAIILLFFGMFIQDRQLEPVQDSSVRAEGVWEEAEHHDQQTPMGCDDIIYENGIGRI